MSAESAARGSNNRQSARVQYRRLRSPTQSGHSLQLPSLKQTVSQWTDGPIDAESDQSTPLTTLKREGRFQLRQLAIEYTQQYSNVAEAERIPDETRPLVMSGHQPLLFHPGVWFKNFALSSLGDAVGATAINLVVDNDVCGPAAIRCPQILNGRTTFKSVRLDDAHADVPYETRPIVESETFASFGTRSPKAISKAYEQMGAIPQRPLVQRLWPEVMAARSALGKDASLGAVLASGRHALERAAGLKTLEIPVSHVARMPVFAQFAAAVISEQQAFNEIYNARLFEYRQVHGIRSTAHPVPQLDVDDNWLESPFWIWSGDSPTRKRLFVKPNGNVIELTDRSGWRTHASLAQLPQALIDLSLDGIAFRPRALMTTLFCRMVLSDRFLHGIGGAKYDQLTDLIAMDFFGLTLPPFSTLTATIHLPFGQPVVTNANQAATRNQIRHRQFHPEQFIDRPTECDALIERKLAAINNTSISKLERHRQITEANQSLQPFLADQLTQLRELEANLPARIESSRILNSREYSFCLFPDSLIEQLQQLAAV